MKKVLLRFLLSGFLIGGLFEQAYSQDKNPQFNVNAGIQTSASFDYQRFTIGAGLDFHLGERIMFSLEIQHWFNLDSVPFVPGAILNFKMKKFFIGGGIFLVSDFKNNFENALLSTKINIGFRSKYWRFTIYMVPVLDDFPEEVLFGTSFGIVF